MQKPVELLILGLATLFIVVGIVFIIAFFLARRRFIIGIISTGGTEETLKLKASGSEMEELQEAVAVMEELVRSRAAASAGRQLEERSEGPPSERSQQATVTCPNCNSRMKAPTSMAGKKVRCASCREPFTVTFDE